jgi:hypothetical protein
MSYVNERVLVTNNKVKKEAYVQAKQQRTAIVRTVLVVGESCYNAITTYNSQLL